MMQFKLKGYKSTPNNNAFTAFLKGTLIEVKKTVWLNVIY